MSSSCVLCVQCCRCLWIVCLRPVSYVSTVADVSGLFIFVLCLVCPMLPMSLDCFSSSCVLSVQCCRCLWIVCLRPVSCVSNAADVSGLFVFVLYLVCPMLPISLDCLSSSCVLCVQCFSCLWIICLRPVSCVSNVADVSGLFVFVLCLVCPMLSMSLDCLSSSCVLCVQCCRCFWIVCLRPVSYEVSISPMAMDLLRRLFISSITNKTLPYLTINEQHGGGLIRNRNYLTFASTWVHPRFFVCSSF